MKTIHDWFDDYGDSHQNKTNKFIHWICIPMIFWSIIALLSIIPSNYLNFTYSNSLNSFFHWGTVVISLGLLFYLRLSFPIFLGMLFFSILIILDIYLVQFFFEKHKFWGLLNSVNLSSKTFLLYLSVLIFIISWILQFLGHKIEGKKPSFFKDIQFLLIGPAWLIGFIFKNLKLNFSIMVDIFKDELNLSSNEPDVNINKEEFIKVINSRRSVRVFTNEKVKEEDILVV